MQDVPMLERHRVSGTLLTLGVLVLVGWAFGTVTGQLLVRLVQLVLGTVSEGR